MPMLLDDVEFVLVRPSRPANVAAACRALKNMGLRRLCLVDPPPQLASPEARALAYGAWDVLDAARHASDLRAAVAARELVVATTGRVEAAALTPRRFARRWARRAPGGGVAVVFGPEASGLRRSELELCPLRLHVPTDPAQPSLNLAQAVLLVAYELRLAALRGEPDAPRPERAASGALESAVEDLGRALEAIGYLNPQNPSRILAELRRLLARARPTQREVTLLRGLARQIGWAGGRLRPSSGRQPARAPEEAS
jgi:TrmH family RNA methyltransferase